MTTTQTIKGLLFAGLIFLSGGILAEDVKNVSANEAYALIRDNSDLRVLDIRTPREFSEGHIKGAININYRDADFEEQLGKLDKNATYILHCRSGGRSSASLSKFEKLGFEHILHLNRGINEWQQAKLPTEAK